MQVFYLSHPFTGNEEKNRIETTKLMQLLGSTFPQYVFLSPIDAMKPMEHLLDYDTILSQTLELLKRCDGIILTGRWQESNGCQAEYDLAKKLCLSISFGVAGFYQQYGEEKGQKKEPTVRPGTERTDTDPTSSSGPRLKWKLKHYSTTPARASRREHRAA